ncbi:MAG: zf-TFIIB domain-containing protein [Planctomycetes bacterium]|nr:zf-TFIIB domain-containing protein [Planctomycetota bacterium]
MSSEPPIGFESDFTLACPYDGQPMEKVQLGKVTIDRCTKCKGVWLDMNEIHQIVAQGLPADQIDMSGPLRATWVPGDRKPKCPRDHSQMIPVSDRRQAHIKYDACTVCGGIMLDAGELKDMTEFSLTERVKAFFRM